MVLDTSLLKIQQYKVRITGKVEQSRERSCALPYTSVQQLLKREPSGRPRRYSPTYFYFSYILVQRYNLWKLQSPSHFSFIMLCIFLYTKQFCCKFEFQILIQISEIHSDNIIRTKDWFYIFNWFGLVWFGLVWFYGISTFVGYLTPNPFYVNNLFY